MHTEHLFPVEVNYDFDLRALIRSGKYADADPDIKRQHFPKERSGRETKDILLFEFKSPMPVSGAKAAFAEQSLRPATLTEVLAFGAKYTEEDLKFPIMALGSCWTNKAGQKGYPYIWAYSGERFVALYWYGETIHTYFRFAAVAEKRRRSDA